MRVFVLAVVLLIAVAATASAQQPQSTNTSVGASNTASSNAPTNVFSKSAIDRAVARTISTTPTSIAQAKTPAAGNGKKSFWKSPWPYIIAGGVTAGVLIAVYSGNNNGTGGGY